MPTKKIHTSASKTEHTEFTRHDLENLLREAAGVPKGEYARLEFILSDKQEVVGASIRRNEDGTVIEFEES